MIEDLKKPIDDLLATGKDALEYARKNSEESNVFFEKLSEKLFSYTGHPTVENKKLKYNKQSDPEEN